MAIELDPGRPASSRSVSITFGHVRSPTTWGSARLMPSMKPVRKRVYAQQLCGMVRLIGQSPSERLGRTFLGPSGWQDFFARLQFGSHQARQGRWMLRTHLRSFLNFVP